MLHKHARVHQCIHIRVHMPVHIYIYILYICIYIDPHEYVYICTYDDMYICMQINQRDQRKWSRTCAQFDIHTQITLTGILRKASFAYNYCWYITLMSCEESCCTQLRNIVPSHVAHEKVTSQMQSLSRVQLPIYMIMRAWYITACEYAYV